VVPAAAPVVSMAVVVPGYVDAKPVFAKQFQLILVLSFLHPRVPRLLERQREFQ